MNGCIEANQLFPEKINRDSEVEARILVDWLSKGKLFIRSEIGEEVNIQGRLLWLLPRVNDSALKCLIEKTLKESIAAIQ